jgi:hypothetical protein
MIRLRLNQNDASPALQQYVYNLHPFALSIMH